MQAEANLHLVRRFAAVDANARLILRRMVSPSCSEWPMVIKSRHGLSAGHPRCLEWADLAKGRLRLDHLPATAVRRLSSPALARIPREARKSPARHPPLRYGRKRCGLIAPRPLDRHRGRDGRGPSSDKET
jgi:hypothetical protein